MNIPRDYWATDCDGQPHTMNVHYHCPACDVSWSSSWSCACDDDCPDCGRSIEAKDWDWLDPKTGDVVPEAPAEFHDQFETGEAGATS